MTQLTLQPQESSPLNVMVIDGDAIPFMIGWHHREHQDKSIVYEALDLWFRDLMLLTNSPHYCGVLAPEHGSCFRYKTYRFKPYKGNRKSADDGSDDWIKFWEPVIREYLVEKYKFSYAPKGLETDDVLSYLGWMYHEGPKNLGSFVIASPDKDLKQVPGIHLDYRKVGDEACTLVEVDFKTATYNLCMQLLCGDTTDNIAGIPGMGPVKAAKLLTEAAVDAMFPETMWMNAVKVKYNDYFGDFYGPIIYNETLSAVMLINSTHICWGDNQFYDVDALDVKNFLFHRYEVKNAIKSPFHQATQ